MLAEWSGDSVGPLPGLASLASRARVPLAVLGVAALLALRLATKHLPQTPALLWSGAMLVSFVGWGSAVGWVLSERLTADWGLRAAWGVGVTLLIGGLLCLLHLARAPMIFAHTAIGVALAAFFALLRERAPSRRTLRVLAAAPGLGLMIALAYGLSLAWLYASLGNLGFNYPDDHALYFAFPRKILATGTMFEPLAARRLQTLGGQDYLHAMFTAVAPIWFLHGVDRGIFVVLDTALVVGAFTSGGLRTRHVVPLGLALLTQFTLPDVLVNSTSLYSGVALLLGLFRTLRWAETARPGPWSMDPRRATVLGFMAATCVVVRTPNLVPVATFLALAIGADFAAHGSFGRRDWLGLAAAAGVVLVAALVTLAPWSLLLRASCGTLFFPPGRGNLTAGFELVHRVDTPRELASALVASLFHDKALSCLLALTLAAMVPVPKEGARGAHDALAIALCALAGLFAVCLMGAWTGPQHLPRYFFSYFAAAAIAIVISAKSSLLGRMRPPQVARLTVIAAAVVGHVLVTRADVRTFYATLVTDADRLWSSAQKVLTDFDKPAADYADLQAHVPAGRAMAVAVLQPFRFDFARNEVDLLDSPMGGMGPPPGFPHGEGPEALARYLEGLGVRYLVFTDFEVPTMAYGRAHWEEFLSDTGENKSSYLQAQAPYHLDVIASIQALAKSRRVLRTAGTMTLLDLGTPAAPH
jgi:hypothetical protein